jgi:ATP-dependent Lon protease
MTEPTRSTLPLLPLRRGVILPGSVVPIPVGRKRSRAMAERLDKGDVFVLGVQFDGSVEEPAIADLHPIAVVARVHDRRLQGSKNALILAEGLERVRLTSVRFTDGYAEVETEPVSEENGSSSEAEALSKSLRELVLDAVDDAEVRKLLADTIKPGLVADRVVSLVDVPKARKAEVLHALDVEVRLRLAAELFHEARAQLELQEKIDSEVRTGLNKTQREALLRHRLAAIRKELGESADDGDATNKLEQRVEEADLPDEVRKVAERELRRLQSAQGPESNVIRNYLEQIVELPWTERAQTVQDIDAIASALDADHHGLDEVKRRILEHMAVLKLSGSKARGTILALVGPPGVGKTSLAQSVADATGRPLARVSLGGVRDEAEIRGHRRTYVGALPGRVLHAMRKVGVVNPVIVLDEIDKLGRGWAGDPEAALLEVLDPEQNATFTDHYLELPYDLSQVLFITTANELSSLSAPLRDRLEIIEVSGYTVDEKIRIGLEHLWPQRLEEHGLDVERVSLSDEAIAIAVREYTREAGVRQLSRELSKLCRSLALELARKDDGEDVAVDETRLRAILGRPRFFEEPAERERPPGVAAGLAWTPVGGDVLYIETTMMPGKGRLEITGQLGDVMSESAKAALAYVRTHAETLGIDSGFLDHHDLHIHVPAGGVPKDGPSAGVTIFTALASLLTGRRVVPDVVMTGEATLRGRVLPVGGIKSKVLAAHRAGFSHIVLPKRNERDLDEIPESVLAELEVTFASDMQDVLAVALEAKTELGELAPSSRSTTKQPNAA